MQRSLPAFGSIPAAVSILTRPGGRVQPKKTGLSERSIGFNPHPSRRTGATPPPRGFLVKEISFQSSPVPEDGCNTIRQRCGEVQMIVSILTRPGGRVQPKHPEAVNEPFCFNPHPSRRTGATEPNPRRSFTQVFQSSPVPEDGCNKTMQA